jgi:hypothetical protein
MTHDHASWTNLKPLPCHSAAYRVDGGHQQTVHALHCLESCLRGQPQAFAFQQCRLWSGRCGGSPDKDLFEELGAATCAHLLLLLVRF